MNAPAARFAAATSRIAIALLVAMGLPPETLAQVATQRSLGMHVVVAGSSADQAEANRLKELTTLLQYLIKNLIEEHKGFEVIENPTAASHGATQRDLERWIRQHKVGFYLTTSIAPAVGGQRIVRWQFRDHRARNQMLEGIPLELDGIPQVLSLGDSSRSLAEVEEMAQIVKEEIGHLFGISSVRRVFVGCFLQAFEPRDARETKAFGELEKEGPSNIAAFLQQSLGAKGLELSGLLITEVDYCKANQPGASQKLGEKMRHADRVIAGMITMANQQYLRVTVSFTVPRRARQPVPVRIGTVDRPLEESAIADKVGSHIVENWSRVERGR